MGNEIDSSEASPESTLDSGSKMLVTDITLGYDLYRSTKDQSDSETSPESARNLSGECAFYPCTIFPTVSCDAEKCSGCSYYDSFCKGRTLSNEIEEKEQLNVSSVDLTKEQSDSAATPESARNLSEGCPGTFLCGYGYCGEECSGCPHCKDRLLSNEQIIPLII